MTSRTRKERDTLGEIEVSGERLWGAQTERSLRHFKISHETLPESCLEALGYIKWAAAETNVEVGKLPRELGVAIAQAAREVAEGRHLSEFPLVVWQTGSGTQSHMNVNEVIANRASEILGGDRGLHRKVHENDHVNLGQSSNDVFSSALHLLALFEIDQRVAPSLERLAEALRTKAEEYQGIIKIGRTHLQDATPLSLGQEISGWVSQLQHGLGHLRQVRERLCELPLGGTAVGTGLNTHPEFAERAVARLSELTGLGLKSAVNKFEAQAAHDAIVFAHGAIKTIAGSLTKVANDVRWLASGPRSGLGELTLPENEPGSSIMPGKVNPTQCEALLMCCTQVFGNDVVIGIAGSSGNFELNVQKPLLAYSFAQSARLLSSSMNSFVDHLVMGMYPNRSRIDELMRQSLMLVTALTPEIGYEKAAHIAKLAHKEGLTLREAAVSTGLLSAEDFDRLVQPEAMTKPG